jgi:hypothetical protein
VTQERSIVGSHQPHELAQLGTVVWVIHLIVVRAKVIMVSLMPTRILWFVPRDDNIMMHHNIKNNLTTLKVSIHSREDNINQCPRLGLDIPEDNAADKSNHDVTDWAY